MKSKILIFTFLLLSISSCHKCKEVDLGPIVDFEVRGNWPAIATVKLLDGTKMSIPGISFVYTGQHVIHCCDHYEVR
jgi:hypothetical protein